MSVPGIDPAPDFSETLWHNGIRIRAPNTHNTESTVHPVIVERSRWLRGALHDQPLTTYSLFFYRDPPNKKSGRIARLRPVHPQVFDPNPRCRNSASMRRTIPAERRDAILVNRVKLTLAE